MNDDMKKESLGVKFLKGLLVILIPLVFLLTVTSLFLKLSGFNVAQEAALLTSKIPVVSHFVKAPAKAANSTAQQTDSHSQSTLADLKKQLSDETQKVTTLQQQNNQLQKTITNLKKQLADQATASKQAANQSKMQQEAAKANVVAMTYQNMDPQKAAAIFEKMSIQDAADNLNLLNNQTKASIMEYLNPDTAAKITPLLAANPYQSTANSTSSTGTGTP